MSRGHWVKTETAEEFSQRIPPSIYWRSTSNTRVYFGYGCSRKFCMVMTHYSPNINYLCIKAIEPGQLWAYLNPAWKISRELSFFWACPVACETVYSDFLDSRHTAVGSGCSTTAGIASALVPLTEIIMHGGVGTYVLQITNAKELAKEFQRSICPLRGDFCNYRIYTTLQNIVHWYTVTAKCIGVRTRKVQHCHKVSMTFMSASGSYFYISIKALPGCLLHYINLTWSLEKGFEVTASIW